MHTQPNLNKFHNAIRQRGLAESPQILDDVTCLQSNRNSSIQRVCCQLVLMNVLWSAHWLKSQMFVLVWYYIHNHLTLLLLNSNKHVKFCTTDCFVTINMHFWYWILLFFKSVSVTNTIPPFTFIFTYIFIWLYIKVKHHNQINIMNKSWTLELLNLIKRQSTSLVITVVVYLSHL